MKYYETVGGRNIFWVRSERYVLFKKERKRYCKRNFKTVRPNENTKRGEYIKCNETAGGRVQELCENEGGRPGLLSQISLWFLLT